LPPLLSNLQPFGVLLAAGVGLGLLASERLCRAAGLEGARGASAFVAGAIAALVGARLIYVLGSPARESALEVLALGRGGLSGYGALATGSAVFAWVLSRAREPVWAWLDVAGPGLLVSAVLGRLGCLLTGCDFGVPARSAVLARLGAFPGLAEPAHPTQLYEAALLLARAIASVLGHRVKRRSGQLFVGCVLGYALVRFSLEPLRGDPERGVFRVLTVTQAVALASVVAVLVAWRRAGQRAPSST